MVTRICGGLRSCVCRSPRGVSPVRTAVRNGAKRCPADNARSVSSVNGNCRFRSISLLSAFRGDTYSTCTCSSQRPANQLCHSRSMQTRNAASVLPEPVGAAIRVWRPAAIEGQPRRCGTVGSPNRSVNHSAINGWNPSHVIRLKLRAIGTKRDYLQQVRSERIKASCR